MKGPHTQTYDTLTHNSWEKRKWRRLQFSSSSLSLTWPACDLLSLSWLYSSSCLVCDCTPKIPNMFFRNQYLKLLSSLSILPPSIPFSKSLEPTNFPMMSMSMSIPCWTNSPSFRRSCRCKSQRLCPEYLKDRWCYDGKCEQEMGMQHLFVLLHSFIWFGFIILPVASRSHHTFHSFTHSVASHTFTPMPYFPWCFLPDLEYVITSWFRSVSLSACVLFSVKKIIT